MSFRGELKPSFGPVDSPNDDKPNIETALVK